MYSLQKCRATAGGRAGVGWGVEHRWVLRQILFDRKLPQSCRVGAPVLELKPSLCLSLPSPSVWGRQKNTNRTKLGDLKDS